MRNGSRIQSNRSFLTFGSLVCLAESSTTRVFRGVGDGDCRSSSSEWMESLSFSEECVCSCNSMRSWQKVKGILSSVDKRVLALQ